MGHREDGPTGRMFRLVRKSDGTGVSGTGHVASGVHWPDGSVTLKWHTLGSSIASVAHYPSIQNMVNIHGHFDELTGEYGTEYHYVEKKESVHRKLFTELAEFTYYLGDYVERTEKGLNPSAKDIRQQISRVLDVAAAAA